MPAAPDVAANVGAAAATPRPEAPGSPCLPRRLRLLSVIQERGGDAVIDFYAHRSLTDIRAGFARMSARERFIANGGLNLLLGWLGKEIVEHPHKLIVSALSSVSDQAFDAVWDKWAPVAEWVHHGDDHQP